MPRYYYTSYEVSRSSGEEKSPQASTKYVEQAPASSTKPKKSPRKPVVIKYPSDYTDSMVRTRDMDSSKRR